MANTPQSTGPHKFHMEGWISCAPFEQLLHMDIVEASKGCLLYTSDAADED